MSIRWIMLMLLMAYAVNTLASIDDFNETINSSDRDQKKFAAEIQTQLGITNEKTLIKTTEKDSVALEGFKLRLFK